MADREKVIKGLRFCFDGFCFDKPLGIVSCDGCVYSDSKTFKNGVTHCCLGDDAIELLKEHDAVAPLTIDDAVSEIMDKHYKRLKEKKAVEPNTIPEELKQKMWNALYAEEDKFEEKYVGTKEHSNWFITYRPWLQKGFNLAIKAIADWEGR